MYAGQTGRVVADKTSKSFAISRGTKQGDPISPTIFNALLEFALKDVIALWRRRGWGIALEPEGKNQLCTLRFADDILLLATSKSQLTTMLKELADAVAKVGLELHAEKTKILANLHARQGSPQKEVRAKSMCIQILSPEESTMYLGRMLNIESHDSLHDKEIDNRIRAAWRKFWASSQELTGRKFGLRARLRLLDSVVGSTLLYGCGCWTLTGDRA